MGQSIRYGFSIHIEFSLIACLLTFECMNEFGFQAQSLNVNVTTASAPTGPMENPMAIKV